MIKGNLYLLVDLSIVLNFSIAGQIIYSEIR